jgi:hypothetical protein
MKTFASSTCVGDESRSVADDQLFFQLSCLGFGVTSIRSPGTLLGNKDRKSVQAHLGGIVRKIALDC